MQPVSKSIYLINPLADFPSYFSAEVFEAWALHLLPRWPTSRLRRLPPWHPAILRFGFATRTSPPIDFDAAVDFVGITGKVSQWGRMKSIAEEFRRRGVIVVIGGRMHR